MAGGSGKAHDAGDAAAYLLRYLSHQERETISAADVKKMIAQYQIQGVSV